MFINIWLEINKGRREGGREEEKKGKKEEKEENREQGRMGVRKSSLTGAPFPRLHLPPLYWGSLGPDGPLLHINSKQHKFVSR